MASIHLETLIDTPPEAAWDAIRDVSQIHVRLAPGVLANTEMEPDGGARIVTFRDGRVVREPILDVDDGRRRASWSLETERLSFYCASLQVFDAGAGKTRAVWIADFLPHTAKEVLSSLIAGNLAAIKAHLESVATATV